MINATSRTQCLGDDARLVVHVSSAGSIDSYREWCSVCLYSCHQSLDICGVSNPASNFAFWKIKVCRGLSALTNLCFSDVGIVFIPHCAPVLLKRPKPILIATFASCVPIVSEERFDVVFRFACAVDTLLLRNTDRGFNTTLNCEGSF